MWSGHSCWKVKRTWHILSNSPMCSSDLEVEVWAAAARSIPWSLNKADMCGAMHTCSKQLWKCVGDERVCAFVDKRRGLAFSILIGHDPSVWNQSFKMHQRWRNPLWNKGYTLAHFYKECLCKIIYFKNIFLSANCM